MTNAAILVTARGYGSETRDDDRIAINGQPLIAYPFRAATESCLARRLYLSTFSDELCQLANEHGISPIKRPPFLARQSTTHCDVVAHALEVMEREDEGTPELLAVVVGNIVTFETGIVDRCLQILIDNPHVDTVVTMAEMNEFHPLRAKRLHLPVRSGPEGIDEESPLFIEPYLDVQGKVSTNRQDLTPAYFLNFAVMALRTATCFTGKGQWPHAFCGPVVVGIETEHCRDIVEKEDVAYSEAWLREHGRLL